MMSLARPASGLAVVLASFALVASCSSPSTSAPPRLPGAAAKAAAAPEHAPLPTAGARPARKAPATFAQRPPPPTATAAMKGEPSGKSLAETRLVATTCEATSAEQIELTVKAMRAAVDASFKTWHDGQPDCWQQDREEFEFQKELQRSGSIGGHGRGFGYGGASLAGGSGPTVRSAMSDASFGRLSGSHASRSPAAPPGKSADGAPAKATSASGTNNQVASVDEADIVKTDGRYVYLAANGALRIVEALNPASSR